MRKNFFKFVSAVPAFMAAALLTMGLAACSDDKKDGPKDEDQEQEDPEGTTYNFFDPADCDADGWLWLDSQTKIDKYVGVGKKIQLIDAPYEVEDPNFPGTYYVPETTANASVKGYNTDGVEGGAGSKTGGIILPEADGHGFFGTHGGGILVKMPDCAVFDIYLSQSLPDVYTWIYGARGYVDSFGNDNYIWNEDESGWDDSVEYGPLKGVKYAGYDMNIQDIKYDLNFGEGTPDNLQIFGEKGELRTAGFFNFSLCPMIIQGIRIKTFTNVNK